MNKMIENTSHLPLTFNITFVTDFRAPGPRALLLMKVCVLVYIVSMAIDLDCLHCVSYVKICNKQASIYKTYH